MQQFFLHFPTVHFQKNDIIIRPHDELSHVYFVKSGKVRMYTVSPEGEEITLHIFNENSYFPIMLILANKINTYYFQTLDEAITFKAPVDEVISYLKINPTELFDLTTRLSFAILGLTERIETLAIEHAYTKVTNLLLYFAKKFGPEIEMTHEDIASWLGLKRETVSRQIERLEKEGRVTYKNKKLFVTNITE
jgi:CRP-like cAMP-binding protein